MQPHTTALLEAAAQLAERADAIEFSSTKIHSIYNPLIYAWRPHKAFISRYGEGPKRVLFVGMNPGPWGMAQTGVPFGEVGFVRDWLGIDERVDTPPREHPKRKIMGFRCTKSEVSGSRLWGLMKDRFGSPEAFFREHFTVNYCPLVFMEESGKNLTPDKLRKEDRESLFAACRDHMTEVIRILRPEAVVGIGKFAESQLLPLAEETNGLRVSSILHPSPANPRANKGWAALATEKLESEGIW